MLGRTISHYRIVSQLGAGGMGVVYGAEDVRLGRPVALKFVHDELAQDRHALDRFQFEARAASALNHPNICTIYDIGEDGPHPFIVMELMKGQTLRDRLATGSMKTHQIVDVGIQVADALDAAHGQGIVHRDIKPANIFLTDRGQAKVLDFGLAKLSLRQGLHAAGTTAAATEEVTAAAITMGTVAYMSPEQVAGDDLDGRTDLFSLGVVLYECATGHRPFAGDNSVVVLNAILNRAPIAPVVLNPELPIRLQEIINNCLEKDRELRYQTAADLRADLKRARRDLESGHSGAVIRRAGNPPSHGLAADADQAGSAAREAVPVADGPAAGSGGATPAARPGRMRRLVVAASVLAVALMLGGSYWLWRRPVTATPTGAATVAPSSPAVGGASTPAALPAAPVDSAPESASAPGARATAPRKEPVAAPQSTSGRAAVRDAPTPAAPTPRRRDTIPSDALPEMTASPPASTPSSATAAAPAAPPVQPPTPAPVQAAVPPPTPSPAPPPENTPAAGAGEPRDARNPAPAPAEEDEAAIRRVVTSYARAIETKNLSLFRSLKPNLSREEEQRLEQGFRAVSTQRVSLTVVGIDRRGSDARVRVRRRDVFQAGGRTQTTETEQLLTLSRTAGGWIIVEIGR